MTNKNLKSIVDLIKKTAQDSEFGTRKGPGASATPTPPPGGGPSTGSGRAPFQDDEKKTPPKSPVRYYNPGSPTIKEMQKSIQNFAKVAVDYKTKFTQAPDPKNPKKTVTKEVLVENDPRKDFNDFIAEQYTNGSSIHGVEFDPNSDAVDRADKKPTDNIEMDNVLDGLRRIGSPKPGEKIPDGVWDFRTQNAVMDTYALADALVQITTFMGTVAQKASHTFTAKDLARFASVIPKVKEYPATSKSNVFLSKVSQAELGKSAEVITEIVDKLSYFYQYFYKYVLNHPAYKAAISKQSPMITAKLGGDDPGQMKPEYKSVMNNLGAANLFNVTLPYKGSNPNATYTFPQLSLANFKDQASFRQFMMQSLKYDENDIKNPDIIAKVLSGLATHIKNTLANEPLPVPPKPKTDMSTPVLNTNSRGNATA